MLTLSPRKRAALSPAHLAKFHTRGYPKDSKWEWARHLHVLDSLLLDAVGGKHSRLLVSMGPRHGKSTLCSIYLPAWFLGKFPDRRCIVVGHTWDLASSFSNKSKGVLLDVGQEVFGIELDAKQQAKDRWDIEGHQGGLVALGVNGPVLGRGANLIILDDVIKNSQEATSEVFKAQFRDWFQSTLMSRLEPGGVVVLTGARWTLDDPIGWLLEHEGTEWKWHNFKAISDGSKDDPLGRKPNLPLWPKRWPLESLQKKKADVGSRWFESNFQGNPLPSETAAFKPAWIQLAEELPPEDECIKCRAWDCASSPGRGDYTAGCLISYHTPSKTYFIEHVTRGQWSAGQVKRRITRTAENDGHEVIVRLEREPGASGKIAAESLLEDLQDYDTDSVKASGRKESRWEPMAVAMENQRLYILKERAWAENFIDELLRAPGGKNDDQIDAAALAFSELRKLAA